MEKLWRERQNVSVLKLQISTRRDWSVRTNLNWSLSAMFISRHVPSSCFLSWLTKVLQRVARQLQTAAKMFGGRQIKCSAETAVLADSSWFRASDKSRTQPAPAARTGLLSLSPVAGLAVRDD